jgi:hypothetical protein
MVRRARGGAAGGAGGRGGVTVDGRARGGAQRGAARRGSRDRGSVAQQQLRRASAAFVVWASRTLRVQWLPGPALLIDLVQ